MEYKVIDTPYAYMVNEDKESNSTMKQIVEEKTICGTKVSIETYKNKGFNKEKYMTTYENLEDKMIESILQFKSYVIGFLFKLKNVGISNSFVDARQKNEDFVKEVNKLFSLLIKDDYVGARRGQILKVCGKILQKFQKPYDFFYECFPNEFFSLEDAFGHVDDVDAKLKEFRNDFENFKKNTDGLNFKYLGSHGKYHRVVTTQNDI